MSKVTATINRINQELDKISGLDGIVFDKIIDLEKQTKLMVQDILENHPNASIFDYWGNNKSGLTNVLDEIDKHPLLDEVMNKGEELVAKSYGDAPVISYRIIKYKDHIYYIEHKDCECTALRDLS